jgi:hypothetical protein
MRLLCVQGASWNMFMLSVRKEELKEDLIMGWCGFVHLVGEGWEIRGGWEEIIMIGYDDLN